jgi:L-asparaginase
MSISTVALITTGGTISTLDSGHGAIPHRSGRELLHHLGERRAEVSAKVVDFEKIPGSAMTPQRMAALARAIASELRRPGIAGAVVTHGTDSLEESAYFCHLTIDSPKPVVFTGSMRTGSELSWDGPRNLLDAIKVAGWPRARRLGALLVMNEEIHSARFVTKSNGLVLDAFKSPACGPLGRIYNGEPWLFVVPATTRDVLRPKPELNVALVTALTGDSDSLGEALRRTGLKGLVIGGFGSGRIPPEWIKDIEAAIAAGLPIVLASRTGSGAIDDPYDRGAHYLRSLGLIAAHEIPPHKARIKLMLALGNGLRGKRLKEFIENG